jgi:hypothetical protein
MLETVRVDGRLRIGVSGDQLCPVIRVILLIEFNDFHDGLRVLFLIRPGDAALLQELLPCLGKTGELAGGRVEADVGEMDGIEGGADLESLGLVQKVGDEAEDALFGFGGEGPASRSSTRTEAGRQVGGGRGVEGAHDGYRFHWIGVEGGIGGGRGGGGETPGEQAGMMGGLWRLLWRGRGWWLLDGGGEHVVEIGCVGA